MSNHTWQEMMDDVAICALCKCRRHTQAAAGRCRGRIQAHHRGQPRPAFDFYAAHNPRSAP